MVRRKITNVYQFYKWKDVKKSFCDRIHFYDRIKKCLKMRFFQTVADTNYKKI